MAWPLMFIPVGNTVQTADHVTVSGSQTNLGDHLPMPDPLKLVYREVPMPGRAQILTPWRVSKRTRISTRTRHLPSTQKHSEVQWHTLKSEQRSHMLLPQNFKALMPLTGAHPLQAPECPKSTCSAAYMRFYLFLEVSALKAYTLLLECKAKPRPPQSMPAGTQHTLR